jgi:hypothetical protein
MPNAWIFQLRFWTKPVVVVDESVLRLRSQGNDKSRALQHQCAPFIQAPRTTKSLQRLLSCMNASYTTPQVSPRATVSLMYISGFEPGLRDHFCKIGLWWESSNGFDQILVGLPVRREYTPKHGDD